MIAFDFWRNRLGRKIVVLMIAASAVLSVGAAGVQLFLAYERDRARALNAFDIIESSFREGLEVALWQFNFGQIEVLLDGIYTQQDIVYLRLSAETGQIWERGEDDGSNLTMRDFQLSFSDDRNQTAAVGTLTAGLTLDFVKGRIWEQFLELVFSNFVKTLLASVAMLAIFDRLAARHLRAISLQASQGWLTTDELVKINRTGNGVPDELDDIINSLNAARENIRAVHKELANRLEDLAQANARLADANREQAEFTYAISHDLKSPTNTVRMLLTELREVMGDRVDLEDAEIFEGLDTTIERMGKLVEDVLAYSRTVGEDMSVEAVDLAGEVQAILHDLSGDISSTNSVIELGALPTVTGNALQLRLLLQNLISNAIKFHDPQRRPIVRITARAAPEECVSISVQDNGIGIGPEYHDQIFGLFKRLHTHGSYHGSGIGLTVCQRIVSNHGGTIEVSSDPGEGSTFTIVLPKHSNDQKN
ncbi:MAG: ATP-binding protein [Pseudomonadota bacterium]